MEVPLYLVFGPAFWYGRALSLLAMVAIAACLFVTIRECTGSRVAAAIGALLFVCATPTVRWIPLARVDLPGMALSWAAIALLVRTRPSHRRIPTVAMLLTLAVFTRQTLVLAAPFACTMWLLGQEDVRAARHLLVSFAIGVLCVGGLLALVSRGGFVFHTVIANLNHASIDRLSLFTTEFLREVPVLVLVAGIALLVLRNERAVSHLAAPYALGAAATVFAAGKVGSDWNYFLEACAALGLVSGLAIGGAVRRGRWSWVLASLLLAQVVWSAWIDVGDVGWRRWLLVHDGYSRWTELTAIVEGTPGPVLTDSGMSVLVLNRRPLYYQCFEMTQLARDGRWDDHPIVSDIEHRRFAVIVMNLSRAAVAERWTPAMLDAIARNYSLQQTLVLKKQVEGVLRPNPVPRR